MTNQLNRLTPALESDDLMRTLRFYTEVLGFECVARWPEHRREFAASPPPLLTGSLYFNTNDVEAWWERLRARATVEYPLETFDYGMREFAIRDDCGYLLQFGQDVTD